MTSSIGNFDAAQRRRSALGSALAVKAAVLPQVLGHVLGHVLAWPMRVYRARQVMLQLGRMEAHELRDIGLTRLDLHDANALAFDADPSQLLRRRVEERRRRR